MAKQTAGNNKVLAEIKRTYNTPIFKRSSELMNTGGLAAVEAFVGTFIREEFRAARWAELLTRAGA